MAMLPSDSELVLEVCYITAGQKFKHTCYEAAKGTLIVTSVTVVAALALGPFGFFFGSLFGGGTAYAMHQPFESVPEILMKLNEEQKREFGNELRRLLTTRNVANVAEFIAVEGGLNTLMTFLGNFVTGSLGSEA